MAKETDKTIESPKAQGSDNQGKKGKGILFGLLAFFTAFIIILAVFGGASYFVIHNNMAGLGEQYRKKIQAIPVLKLALPAVNDPDDPKYLTPEEIQNRYQILRKEKEEYIRRLEEANQKTTELQKYKDDKEKLAVGMEKKTKDLEAQQGGLDSEKKKLEEERKKLNEFAARGDLTGFKAYYEKVDKETAQKIYADILKEQKASEEVKKVSAVYEAMDPASAAKVLEQMGNSKIDLVVELMRNIKKEVNAEILAAMDPIFAAKVTEKLKSASALK